MRTETIITISKHYSFSYYFAAGGRLRRRSPSPTAAPGSQAPKDHQDFWGQAQVGHRLLRAAGQEAPLLLWRDRRGRDQQRRRREEEDQPEQGGGRGRRAGVVGGGHGGGEERQREQVGEIGKNIFEQVFKHRILRYTIMEGPYLFIPGNFLGLLKKIDPNHVCKAFVPKVEATRKIFCIITIYSFPLIIFRLCLENIYTLYNAQCSTLCIFPIRDFRSLGFLPGADIHPPPPMEKEPEVASIYGEPADTYNKCGKTKRRLFVHSDTIFFFHLQIAEAAAAAQLPVAFRQERLLQAKVQPPPPPQPGSYARNPLRGKKITEIPFSAHRTRGEPAATATTTSGAATATGSIPTTRDTTVRNRETKKVDFLFHFKLLGYLNDKKIHAEVGGKIVSQYQRK